ncbi:hypothetical protein CERSUDRAFT_117959 [Gelatoporia subvermispora B]|uniref:Uncharacterized protein n=1 Tax=Ceriporiopsis subvermispora (strain B) TaxID=914234 RepID=M2PCD2_CERS8|nr:hypothetical protein CERSUDRAFT_117959 [Gelatoporia subvermispora B]
MSMPGAPGARMRLGMDEYGLGLPNLAQGAGQNQYTFPGLYNTADYALPAPSTGTYHGYGTADPTLPGLPGATGLTPTLGGGAANPQILSGVNTQGMNPEFLARYRAQAELLNRAGVLPSGALSQGGVATAANGGDSAMYDYGRFSGAWNAGQNQHPQAQDTSPHLGTGGEPTLQSHPPGRTVSGAYDTGVWSSTIPTTVPSTLPGTAVPTTLAGSAIPSAIPGYALGGAAGIGSGLTGMRRREDRSEDSASVPSSAGSSSVHLPLDRDNLIHRPDGYAQAPRAGSDEYAQQRADAYGHRAEQDFGGRPEGEGFGRDGFGSTRVGYGTHPTQQQQYAFRMDADSDGRDSDGRSPSQASASSQGHYGLTGSHPGSHHGSRSGTDASGDTGEGGFSSAFGLMSLDDPAVLAGLSADGPQFFSELDGRDVSGDGHSSSTSKNILSGLNLQTPTQDIIAALGKRTSEDTREMREFWKMYMRTPLTGNFALQTPTPGTGLGPFGFPTLNLQGQNQGQGAAGQTARPSPSRRHSRVASLPSMKTPPLLAADARFGDNSQAYQFGANYPPPPPFSLQAPPPSSRSQSQQQGRQGPQPGMRTTLHEAEDLKSYEQAVLARKAPLQLNLIPKRRGTIAGGAAMRNAAQRALQEQQERQQSQQQQAQLGQQSQSASVSPVVPPPGLGPKLNDLLNRPSSSSSTSSTLANAFGRETPPQQFQIPGQGQASAKGPNGHGQMPPPGQMRSPSASSMSNTAVGSTSSTSGSETGEESSSYRPSFKRLASQTLGPENSKRALLGPAGWEDIVDDDSSEDDVREVEREIKSKPAERVFA